MIGKIKNSSASRMIGAVVSARKLMVKYADAVLMRGASFKVRKKNGWRMTVNPSLTALASLHEDFERALRGLGFRKSEADEIASRLLCLRDPKLPFLKELKPASGRRCNRSRTR